MELSLFSFKILAIIVSFLSFGLAAYLYKWVKSQPSSNQRIADIGELIQKGANTFLRREYLALTRFVGIVAFIMLLFFQNLYGMAAL